jgi:hypothetical protein
MRRKLLARRPGHTTVIAYLALFVALGGTSYAAITLKRGSVKGKHIAKNAVTGPKVKNGSLRAGDFRTGELPRGEQGAAGPQGIQGPRGDQGESGPPGAPNPNAANSELLDGIDSTQFVRGRGRTQFEAVAIPAGATQKVATVPDDRFPLDLEYACPATPSGTQGGIFFENDASATINLFIDTGGANPAHYELDVTDGNAVGTEPGGDWVNWHVQSTSSSDGFTVSVASVHRPTSCHVQSQVIQSGDAASAG